MVVLAMSFNDSATIFPMQVSLVVRLVVSSVLLSFFGVYRQFLHLAIFITAPAYPHVTLVAVYLALLTGGGC